MYYEYMVWILWVDDEPLVARAMQRTIERRLGHRVRCAHGPAEVRARLAEEVAAPGAVVLDPDFGAVPADGVGLLAEVRQLAPGARCALFTSAPPGVTEVSLRAIGIVEPVPHFSKPGPTGPLLDWLRSVVGD